MRSLKQSALVWVLLAVACNAHAQKPDVAYTQDGTLYLATASGHVLKTAKTTVSIGEFAISADASRVVFRPVGGEYGGPLYLLNISSGKLERLTKSCFKSAKCSGHVYSDPDFSPNADQIVFAVHYASRGDVVEASGPLAVMDMKGRRMRVLQSTTNIDGQGVAFANDPHWSPDGKQILMSFETGAAVTDADGKKLRNISDLLSGGDWSNAMGWLGNQCVLYIAGKNPEDAQRQPTHALNLTTGKPQSLSEMFNVPDESLADVIALSVPIRVRREGQQLIVEGQQPTWKIPYKPKSTFVRLVPRQEDISQVPAGCKSGDDQAVRLKDGNLHVQIPVVQPRH